MRRHSSAKETIRNVLDGLKGEDSVAALCRCDCIAQSLCDSGSKYCLEANKTRLAGETPCAAPSRKVKDVRCEAGDVNAIVAEQVLELRPLKDNKNVQGDNVERGVLHLKIGRMRLARGRPAGAGSIPAPSSTRRAKTSLPADRQGQVAR